MKLAIIRQRYDAHGGAERFVSRAVDALAGGGAEVTVVARQWRGEGSDWHWQRCDPFYLGRIWRDRGFGRAACAVVAKGNFDLVQSHERIPCCDIYRAGDGVHAQWLQYRSRTLGPFGRLGLALSPFHWHLVAAERRLFASPRLRAVICNSRMVHDEMARWFPALEGRLHVIHNGVDLQQFHPVAARTDREAMRSRLGIPADARVLLFVGSGFERKGVRVLLEAFAKMRRATDRLVIVGRDRHAAHYRSRAELLGLGSMVHWAGAQDDVRPWYGLGDVFVLPTLYDPFPNAALEAMACGLPVVTSAHCGTAEIIRDEWNGFVCRDPLDATELAASLLKALDGAPAMGVNARSRAEAFGLPAMAQTLLELYSTLVSSPGATT